MRKQHLFIRLPVVLILLLIGCSPGTIPQPTPDLMVPVPTEVAAAATLSPTATQLPGKVLLVAPGGAVAPGGLDAQPVQAALAELSEAAGLVFENRETLQKDALTPDIRVVVNLDESINLAEIAGAAPQTQFIAITSTEMDAAGNLTVIRRRLEQQAFVAGFVSVLLSNDYRAGGLLPADGPLDASLQEVFQNGAGYFCGVCTPGWPIVYYPQVAALPGASDGASWQAAAAGMFDNQKVEVFYLSAQAARLEVLEYLQGKAQAGKPVLVVGEIEPPEALKEQWAATLRFDLVSALRLAWPDVVAGQGGAALEAALVVSPSTDVIGEGRIRLVKDLIIEIDAGRVALFRIPRQ